MSNTKSIEKLDGGYVIDGKKIAVSTEELFEYLLIWAEGRARSFKDDLFGSVEIRRETKEGEEIEPA